MSLFIPRKQNLTGTEVDPGATTISGSLGPPVMPALSEAAPQLQGQGSVAKKEGTFDPHHLEQALRDNFLAIQNWANRRGLSVSVRNSSSAQTIVDQNYFAATFNSTGWDYYNLTAGSSGIKIIEPGVWFISAGGQFLNLPASTNLAVDIQLVGGNPSGAQDHSHHPANGGFNNLSISDVIVFSSQQSTISVQARMQGVVPSSSSPPTFTLWEFTATKLFDIPSKVQ